MSKLRVGVLRGGPSSEYEVSLNTGAAVLRSLPREHYEPRDIFIDKSGAWHYLGLPVYPEQVADEIDIFFNCLHGEYGEDGELQRLLTSLDKPFTGPEEVPAMTAINKPMAKSLLARAGILVPPSILVVARVDNYDSAKLAFNKLLPPWVVKPANRGSGVGVSVAKSFNQLVEAIERAAEISEQILIEQFIAGKEATVGVVEGFRGQELYPLLPVEACDKTRFICPGTFTDREKGELAELSRLAHQTLSLRHYSSADFIVTPRGIYLLEVDALPPLADPSRLYHGLSAVGAAEPHFVDHVLNLTRDGR